MKLTLALVCTLGLLLLAARTNKAIQAHEDRDWLDERPWRDIRPDRLEAEHDLLVELRRA